jgi:hypothetical protein
MPAFRAEFQGFKFATIVADSWELALAEARSHGPLLQLNELTGVVLIALAPLPTGIEEVTRETA